MTFTQWAVNFCDARGMFEKDAREVVARLIRDPNLDSMAGRWQKEVEGYPPSVLVTLSLHINKHAIQYIDEVCPEAWYRELFL